MRWSTILLAALLPGAPVFAQQTAEAPGFPVKPVRLVVPFPPGGGSEAFARSIGQKLSERWGQQMIVDNRGGAGGIIGSALVAKAPPDGYTLVQATNGTHGINQSLYRTIPYDTLRDFTPVTMIALGPNLLVVHPSLPVVSVKELVAFAKSKPGALQYGSAGNGSPPHLQAELFKHMAGVNILHVPYKGAGPSTIDLLAGQVQVSFSNVAVVMPHLKARKLRGLATTGAKRPVSLSEYPTIAESGVQGYEASTWYGIFAPARLPAAILQKLNADFVQVLALPEIKEVAGSQGADVVGDTSEHFRQAVAAEVAKWATVIKQLGLQLD